MAVAFDEPLLWYAVLVATAAIAIAGTSAAGVSPGRARDRLEERFLYGVPWGTLVVLAVVLGVYLFVQRGWWDWHRPVVVRYMAFSLFEPIGWGFSGLAHAGPGHLVSNVTSTVVFGPIVEYAWGHYPPVQRSQGESDRLDRPWFRAVVAFPAVIVGLAVVAGLVAWGPVIGFSFVVFALIGCSLVQFPVVTLAALVARTGVRVVYRAVRDPVTITETTTRVVRPSWYGTAVQGHLFGLLVGILLGVGLLRYWRRRPAPGRIWLASCVLGFALSVWAIWWVVGPERFVLFRALGVGLVVALATVIAWTSVGRTDARLPAVGRPPRTVGLAVVLVAIVVMSLIGLGLNAASVGATPDADGIEVDGYELFYAENVTDRSFGVVDVSAFGLSTNVRTSGVVVQSEQRRIWYRAIPAAELRAHGDRSIRIGDLGWSQQVRAARRGWETVDNETVYAVWLDAGEGWEHAWDADPVRAEPVVAAHTFTVAADGGEFFVDVEREGEIDRVAIPTDNETVDVHEISLRRVEGDLVAIHEGTEVRIASRETYD